ncbi:MAG: flavodoxin domain-containing protein [Acidimicrobiia bacterium]
MRVLVTTASKHGSTAEIGRAISEVLSAEGIDARVSEPEDVTGLDGYDAVVLGSAVYFGHWMKSMLKFVERQTAELAKRPVWLFSSGPIPAGQTTPDEVCDVDEIMQETGARGHFIFSGKIDRKSLNFGERAVINAMKGEEGDFRDWDEIRDRALSIAVELKTSV